MNLFQHFRHLLSGASKKPAAPVRNEYEPNNCEYLLANLQRICAMLPDGEASVVMGRNKLDICLTWDTAMQANADNIKKKNKEFQFWLNGKSEVVEWAETHEGEEKTELKATEKENVAVKESSNPTRQQLTMRRLLAFLQLHYTFRYNRLTDRAECAVLNTESPNQDPHHLTYRPVDDRLLHTISLAAMEEGVDCWDVDIKRYIDSEHAPAYHPFTDYFEHLPRWDGKDRVRELARRVSDNDLWVRSFHRWMLAVTAQWMNNNEQEQRANSVAPLLVSTVQGMGKSTFCRMLLPKELRQYFTESFDLTNITSAENKLASYGLINLDEFDRLPATRMPLLKNLMQMESLHIRRAYKRSTEPLPRIASFIGTANRRDLLVDASGSRRFICIEVEKQIDCTTPIDHAQLYAQLKEELDGGERCWFNKQEEAEIQQHNRAFYRTIPAEEVLESCFRFTEPDEQGARLMSAADIYTVLKQKNRAAMAGYSCMAFSRLLAQTGRRVHTRYGNGYWVSAVIP
ncbi:VapE domain-containing protein [Mediterranea massiliensis]|uniref:VapE domain-containing protein n=1 Tax=Mediterranea massiliensis TaxID=1841865 RepID=UPI0025A42577|nr:VapE domain-containing protein [Mediterranea massiliensis]MDM8336556.1 VapE family protein [Mediterranea massiliensis]